MLPHFSMGLEHEIVREGMKLTFEKVLECLDESGCENFMGTLLLRLDSVIYYREEIRKFHY